MTHEQLVISIARLVREFLTQYRSINEMCERKTNDIILDTVRLHFPAFIADTAKIAQDIYEHSNNVG
jgi:NADPH-dependent 7-cyano-7-deazaguanine reductase QueF